MTEPLNDRRWLESATDEVRWHPVRTDTDRGVDTDKWSSVNASKEIAYRDGGVTA